MKNKERNTMSTVNSQGAQANLSGNLLEETVQNVFLRKGFTVVRYVDWQEHPDRYGKELLLTNAKYETIYGHKGKTEFLFLSERFTMNVKIECKWQQVSGSVDEKLPYLYLNCIESMPENHIIIIIDGQGWKEGAISWLRNAVSQKKYTNERNRDKLIEVMDLKDFITWANRTFK
jgi:hypothetical protein